MNKIAIFYHVYQVGDWAIIFNQQIERMKNSGLFDAADLIHIGINGEHLIPDKFPEKVKISRNKILDMAEVPTFRFLYDFCKDNSDYNILFLHTSGVSWSTYKTHIPHSYYYTNKTFWRKYQEYFVIDNWKQCNSLLEKYDCVGAEWKTDAFLAGNTFSGLKHYAGNIWWSKTDYIKKLDWNFISRNKGLERWYCEFLIGSGNPNYYNFYSSNRNLYYYPLYEEEYELATTNLI